MSLRNWWEIISSRRFADANCKKRKQDLQNWASWPVDELVRRWESGDVDYEYFQEDSNVQKLSSAYHRLISNREVPSETELLAISVQINLGKCSTPWKSRFWKPKNAAFPDLSLISDEVDDLVDIGIISAITHEHPNDFEVQTSVESDNIQSGSIMPPKYGAESESSKSIKSQETNSILGKRVREDSTSITTLSAVSGCSGSGRVVEVEAKTKNLQVEIENTLKPETNAEVKIEVKTEIKTETMKDIDIILKREVKDESLAKIVTHAGNVFTDIKDEVEEEDRAKPQGESKIKLDDDIPSISAPGLPAHGADAEKRPPKRERLEGPDASVVDFFSFFAL